MENDFYDISNEYFLKLAPDFSVFEIAEKIITEGKDISNFIQNKLISDNKNDISKWNRAMIKTSAKLTFKNPQTAVKEFKIDSYYIYIAINDLSGGIGEITVANDAYFIGVCF